MKKEHLFKKTTINILKKYGCLYMADDYTDMLLEIEQQQGYSEEDMKKAFNSSSLTNMLDVYDSFEEFIEQFIKK